MNRRLIALSALIPAILLGLIISVALISAEAQARTPSDTVREFYKAMREKRFREAFDMSIYKPAIDGLKPQQFEDLRGDFEKMSQAVPDKIDITGEQISGEQATVFLKVPHADDPAQFDTEPVALIRVNGVWIIGDRENQEVVRKAGADFFFNARIETHHSEVQSIFTRINLAQLAYAQQHNGLYGNMGALIQVGLLPKDLEGTDSTGYRFHINLARDAKSFSVSAEPAQYGRSGKLSFFMDQNGIRSSDTGGKPLEP